MPLDHAHTRDRPPARALVPKGLLAIFVCAFLLAAPILALVPSVKSDPIPGTNADMTRTLTWDFDNPDNYTTTNALVSGGFGTLSRMNQTVLENTQADYATGARLDNVDINTVQNAIVLDQRVRPVTTVVIQPGAADGMDTCLLEFWPDDFSNGEGKSVGIDSVNTKNIRALLEFSLSSIPSDAIVQNATLLVNLMTGNKANPITFNLYALTMNWTENETSWNSASSTQSWATPGGDYDPFIFYRGTMTKTPGWYPIDVSRLVDFWLKGTFANYGMIMVPDNGDNTGSFKYFDSSEANTAANRPKLVVNYTLESPTSGVYESKALGPGTNSQFTLASWSNATHFSLTDEFAGTSLSTKWSWLNRPTGAGDYDVGVTRPGWLHIRGEANRDLVGSSIGANYLYQRVSGSFSSETHVNVSLSANQQGAGMLLVNDLMNWVSFAITGTGPNTKLTLQVTEQGDSVFLSLIHI